MPSPAVRPRALFQSRIQPRQSVLRPTTPPVAPAGAAPIPPEGTNFSSLSFGDQNSLANRGIYEPGSFGDQNARANASSGEGLAGTASNPAPQIPGLSTGLKPVPPQPRTSALPAGASPTGTPLGAPVADSPQAWRGGTQPGVQPKTPPGGDTGSMFPQAGSQIPIGEKAGIDENPNAVPGVFKSVPATKDPLGAGATPSKLTMVQTTPPAPPQQEAHNPLTGGTEGGPMEGQSETVATPPVNPGAAMGISSRGTAPLPGKPLPSPMTANEEHFGGEGAYKKKFSNARSAALYGSYVKNLFGGPQTV